MRILVPLGTRPEIVKLSPVVRALEARGFSVRTVATGQHFDMSLAGSFFSDLGLTPAARWTLPAGESDRLGEMTRLAHVEIAAYTPDLVLVLGDTNTVPIFCLAARRQGVAVVHVEAGLRSFNAISREEVNRKVAVAAASLHFAPTSLAAEFLAREGVPRDRIEVVGNPGIDAVLASGIGRRDPAEREGVLVTAHRPSNVDEDEPLGRLVDLIERLGREFGPVLFPVHPRTRARLTAGTFTRLAEASVKVVEPLPYVALLRALASSRLVVTDSGGLQEEAAWLGVPTVVLRRSTPRWESIATGAAVLVGLDGDRALEAARMLVEAEAQRRIAALPCPYGDGSAGERIAEILATPRARRLLRLEEPDWVGLDPPGTVRAVLFDLDDTLYSQGEWLDGAWRTVAEAAVPLGVDPVALQEALQAIAAEGSARGEIIDRAVASVGADPLSVGPLVEAFRAYAPVSIPLRSEVAEALERLRARVPVGLVTDGDIRIQRAKLNALGLADAFDPMILSDAFGRDFRKPSSVPFVAAVEQLGLRPNEVAYVGDHPVKDVVGATTAGLRAIRVLSGEYATVVDEVRPWGVASDVVAAIELLEPLLPRTGRSLDANNLI